jgi:hypothetical protein
MNKTNKQTVRVWQPKGLLGQDYKQTIGWNKTDGGQSQKQVSLINFSQSEDLNQLSIRTTAQSTRISSQITRTVYLRAKQAQIFISRKGDSL